MTFKQLRKIVCLLQ